MITALPLPDTARLVESHPHCTHVHARPQVNALIAICDNPLSSLANELGKRTCDIVRSCIAGALTAIKEVIDVASEVCVCVFYMSHI